MSWWRHQMETFSASLAISRNSPVPGEFPTQRPVTRSFDAFFDMRLNKRLSKQSWGWWLETLSRPLWRHRNLTTNLHSDHDDVCITFRLCGRMHSNQVMKTYILHWDHDKYVLHSDHYDVYITFRSWWRMHYNAGCNHRPSGSSRYIRVLSILSLVEAVRTLHYSVWYLRLSTQQVIVKSKTLSNGHC